MPSEGQLQRVATDNGVRSHLVCGEGWTLRAVRWQGDSAEVTVTATSDELATRILGSTGAASPTWVPAEWRPADLDAEAPALRVTAGPWSTLVGRVDAPPAYTRHVTLAYGAQQITNDDAQLLDIDEERVMGLEVDVTTLPSGHGWEAGVNIASGDGRFMGLDGAYESRELYVGYRRTFFTQLEGVQPYLSVGLTHVRAEVELGSASDHDSSLGGYGRLGVDWELDGRVRMGVDYRRVFGTDIDALGLGLDADHDQLALTLGFGF
jgi:hypothetical protein